MLIGSSEQPASTPEFPAATTNLATAPAFFLGCMREEPEPAIREEGISTQESKHGRFE